MSRRSSPCGVRPGLKRDADRAARARNLLAVLPTSSSRVPEPRDDARLARASLAARDPSNGLERSARSACVAALLVRPTSLLEGTMHEKAFPVVMRSDAFSRPAPRAFGSGACCRPTKWRRVTASCVPLTNVRGRPSSAWKTIHGSRTSSEMRHRTTTPGATSSRTPKRYSTTSLIELRRRWGTVRSIPRARDGPCAVAAARPSCGQTAHEGFDLRATTPGSTRSMSRASPSLPFSFARRARPGLVADLRLSVQAAWFRHCESAMIFEWPPNSAREFSTSWRRPPNCCPTSSRS